MSDENAPVAAATVMVYKSMLGTVTDAHGNFTLSNLPAGSYVLAVRHIAFEPKSVLIHLERDTTINIALTRKALLSEEFIVEATRATINAPFTTETFDRERIDENNLGQDIPILLNQAVSTVTTSDAGAGIGYTGLRIRGSDATRINVTVNGVPLNDAESHGVFWVNMPDIASSISSLQIQRGVGTSSNGAGAFGATINIETIDQGDSAFAEFNNSYGSFNTRKHNVLWQTGRLSSGISFGGRLSYVRSDGYIDRSGSDLKSYYITAALNREKYSIRLVNFAGHEITHQAWWGTPESRLYGTEQDMLDHAYRNGYSAAQIENLLNSGRTYNHYLYENEIDNYQQHHYQLITGWQVAPALNLNVTGHYTRGFGFFEQYKYDAERTEFGLPALVLTNDTINETDAVVRRWLDNHFYGAVYSLIYEKQNLQLTFGGAANQYIGDHYGELIWMEWAAGSDIHDRYYSSVSDKVDVSNYIKALYTIGKVSLFGDVQHRYIQYQTAGVDNDQRPIDVKKHYNFINPKGGITWNFRSNMSVYGSVARASREPVRSDFTDALPGTEPQPEYLTNGELGWVAKTRHLHLQVNGYYMYYENQLVLTGEVNDVGSPIRTNVPVSYRAGVELAATMKSDNGLFWRPNLTLSRNKIRRFTEVIYDYTSGFDVVTIEHTNTDIAYSPSIIAGSEIGVSTDFGLSVAVLSKYVGQQYLDNTSNPDRIIRPYFVNDLRVTYLWTTEYFKELEIKLLVNNILNAMYASNGYTYSYIYGQTITENFYYPQAGINFLAGVSIRL
ncbi:MAG: TonB-dependent receptor [Salibacteraceae bacterium]